MDELEYHSLLAHLHAIETVVLLLCKRADAASIVSELSQAREAVMAASLYTKVAGGPQYAVLVDQHLQRIDSTIRDLAGLGAPVDRGADPL